MTEVNFLQVSSNHSFQPMTIPALDFYWIWNPNAFTQQKAIEIVKKATDEDQKGNYEEALKNYMHSLEYFMAAVKCKSATHSHDWLLWFSIVHACDSMIAPDEKNERIKESIRKKITEYLERAEKLKEHLAKPKMKAIAADGSATAK